MSVSTEHPLSKAEFDEIYSKVPRLSVEIVLRNEAGEVYMTKRSIPCKGVWHLPGGTVRFGEPMLEAVKRVAARELGVEVQAAKQQGYIEYPSHYLNGMDSPVGIVFEVTECTGTIARDVESSDGGWFSQLPDPMHADQDAYLLEHGYLKP